MGSVSGRGCRPCSPGGGTARGAAPRGALCKPRGGGGAPAGTRERKSGVGRGPVPCCASSRRVRPACHGLCGRGAEGSASPLRAAPCPWSERGPAASVPAGGPPAPPPAQHRRARSGGSEGTRGHREGDGPPQASAAPWEPAGTVASTCRRGQASGPLPEPQPHRSPDSHPPVPGSVPLSPRKRNPAPCPLSPAFTRRALDTSAPVWAKTVHGGHCGFSATEGGAKPLHGCPPMPPKPHRQRPGRQPRGA